MPRVTARIPRTVKAPVTAPTKPSNPLAAAAPKPPREAGIAGARPANGSVRACVPQRGELLHHRVMSADGRDVAVVTAIVSEGFVTGVYPVQQGYLVMLRQPLYEIHSPVAEDGREQHEQLVRVVAGAGTRIIRVRRQLEQTARREQAQRWMPEANQPDQGAARHEVPVLA